MIHPPPAWLAQISDPVIARTWGAGAAQRGAEYQAEGRVGVPKVLPGLVTATVRGSGRNTYVTSVRLTVTDPTGLDGDALARQIRLLCTCPMRNGCKHGVALLLQLRELVGPSARASAWRTALAQVLPRPDQRAPGGSVPLAVQTRVVVRDVEFRPVYLGSRGWARGQLNWQNLSAGRAMGHDPVHAELLREFKECAETGTQHYYGYGTRSSHLLLSQMGPQVWSQVARMQRRGVAFVPDKGEREIEWSEEAIDLVMRVSADGDGLTLGAQTLQGGEPVRVDPFWLIGDPAHGAVLSVPDEPLRLAPFSSALSGRQRLMLRFGSLQVPSDEVADFAHNYLPLLRESVEVGIDEDVELPEAGRPRLVVVLTAQPAQRRAFLDLSLRYGDDDSALEVSLRRGMNAPIRDREAEARLLDGLPEPDLLLGPSRTVPSERVLEGREMLQVAALLPALRLHEDVLVEVRGELPDYQQLTEAPEIELTVSDTGAGKDWFDLDITVTVAGVSVPLALLIAALTAGDDHLLLDSGQWFSLDVPELDRLRELVAEARALVDPDSDGSRLQLRPVNAGWWADLEALGVVRHAARVWQDAMARMLAVDELAEVAAPPGLRAELRPYQLVGVQWMERLRHLGLGGILADDMGLGKTLQALALVQSVKERGLLGAPVVVVAPSSVVGAWVEQAARFVPELRVAVVDATTKKSKLTLSERIQGADLVVTSYAVARLDVDQFSSEPWTMALLDEAQFVKNPASRTYQAMRRLGAPVTFVLTGTPLENNLMDLWTMLSLAAPGLFPDPKAFTERYRKPIEDERDSQALERLTRRVRPVMLRRTKEVVAPELPERVEQVVRVELSPAHRRVYDRQLQRERQKVLGLVGDLGRHRLTILRSLTVLRQLSLAPGLVDEQNAALGSAKIDYLVEMLDEVVAGGHRALVFSQFTGFLKLVRERLDAEGIGHVHLDGRTRDRQAKVEAFRTGDDPVFLISLKAGGFGLTLTEADYVFVLDPWWNPAAEAQAVDRAHRIGQDKTVMVYRLVAEKTIEDKVVALQERKRALFDQVIGSGRGSDEAIGSVLSADDIRSLLEP